MRLLNDDLRVHRILFLCDLLKSQTLNIPRSDINPNSTDVNDEVAFVVGDPPFRFQKVRISGVIVRLHLDPAVENTTGTDPDSTFCVLDDATATMKVSFRDRAEYRMGDSLEITGVLKERDGDRWVECSSATLRNSDPNHETLRSLKTVQMYRDHYFSTRVSSASVRITESTAQTGLVSTGKSKGTESGEGTQSEKVLSTVVESYIRKFHAEGVTYDELRNRFGDPRLAETVAKLSLDGSCFLMDGKYRAL